MAGIKKGRNCGPFDSIALVMLYLMAVLDVFAFTTETTTYNHEEHRYEEDGQNGCCHHPAHYAGTNGVLCTGACTRADNQRHNAEDKRQ